MRVEGRDSTGANEEAPDGASIEKQDAPDGHELLGEQPSAFAHPWWALPMMIVLAVPFLVWGIFGHPVWLLLGSPFILVLVVWAGVQWVQWRRRSGDA